MEAEELRERVGIEPTSLRISEETTVLKTAEATRLPSIPEKSTLLTDRADGDRLSVLICAVVVRSF